MTDPDVKNLRKLVKRARHLASVKDLEKHLEWYARLQRDLTELNRRPSWRDTVRKWIRTEGWM